ncbi:hypothetical protein [Veillonella tobetsuensis]|uniref:Lipoprotein n=1 Tax=Veillonella tobetsuensis TaxID=1110546 RepID=A0A2S7ZQT4_9FIRM|nr:hypothetical protein [Veillonella tobetsuensis]PQL25611.1 hypothetical protein VTHSUH11_02460 [Veillonella tobetsuensis]
MKTSKALLKLLVVGCLSVSCALPLTASAEDTSTQSVTQESVVKTELPSGVNRIQLLKSGETTATVKTSSVVAGHAYIPKDTNINLELIDPISSKKSKEGNTFRLKTIENILINDVVVIPANQEVLGTITKARKNGMLGRKGRLEFKIDSIKTINGVNVPLTAEVKGKGHSDNGAVAVAAAVSLVGGLFMKGTNIYYEPGQKFVAVVSTDTDLNTTVEDLPNAMNPSKPTGQNIVLPIK